MLASSDTPLLLGGGPEHLVQEEERKLQMIQEAGFTPEEADEEQLPMPYDEFKDQPGL